MSEFTNRDAREENRKDVFAMAAVTAAGALALVAVTFMFKQFGGIEVRITPDQAMNTVRETAQAAESFV